MTRQLRGLTWAMARGTEPLRASAVAFRERRPDVTITWTALPWEQFRSAQRGSMAESVGRFDLIMFDQPWTGDYAAHKWLIPLESTVSAADLLELRADLDAHSLGCYSYDEHIWGWPVDAACQTLTYRADLLDAAVPDSWEDTLALGAARTNGEDRFGFAHMLDHPVALTLFVLSVAAALGERPCAEPGDGLAPDSLVEALTIVRRIRSASVPSAIAAGRRPFEIMRTQPPHVALWPAAFPYLDGYVGDGRPSLRLSAMPRLDGGGMTTASGGVGLGIAANSADRETAAEYAWFVMSRQVQSGVYLANHGQPSRQSALRSELARGQYGDNAADLADLLEECYVRPHWPGWTTAEHQLGVLIAQCVAGQLDPREVVRASRRLGGGAPS